MQPRGDGVTESRVQVTFLTDLQCVMVIRMPGWVVIAMEEGVRFPESLTSLRELLSPTERDSVRRAFGVAPLGTDPSVRAWLPAAIPDQLCPCVIPVQLRALDPWYAECRMHNVGSAVPANGSLP
jgi:hypothetical protein